MSAIQAQCTRLALANCFDDLLSPSKFKDYCPNGLQVEGKTAIRKLVSGVTASLALIDAAIAAKADAIVVHHGYFFRGEDERVTGQKRMRLTKLLQAELNLFAFHLPLDAHPTLGNNAQLAAQLGLPVSGYFGDSKLGAPLGMFADLAAPSSTDELQRRLLEVLGRQPQMVGKAAKIARVAWCTGAAQDMLQVAIDIGADAFISGEISERTTHLAQELGCAYFAAGHHATERYGVRALGNAVAEALHIQHEFIDIDNPV